MGADRPGFPVELGGAPAVGTPLQGGGPRSKDLGGHGKMRTGRSSLRKRFPSRYAVDLASPPPRLVHSTAVNIV